MLRMENAHVVFHPQTDNERVALHDVDLHLKKDDFLCIVGGNGAGKTTLMNVISGTIKAQHGTLFLEDEDITNMAEHRRCAMIGRIFQDPLKGTAPHLTVLENLSLAYGRGRRSYFQKAVHKQDIAYFKERLAALGLGLEDRLDNEVGLLSGGQRQALTLIMATLIPPKLLLLDEHTAALDPKTAERIMQETERIISAYHIPAMMITHNLSQALRYGNRLLVMKDGSIIKDMTQQEKEQLTIAELMHDYEIFS